MTTDPSSIFTFHDTFQEIPSTNTALFEISTLGYFEPPLNMEQCPPSYLDHQPDLKLNDLFDLEGPLSDPFICALSNGSEDDSTGNFQAGYSGHPGEGCSSHGINENYNGSQNPVIGDNRMPALGFSVAASQYYCTGCQTLREITHTNGMHVKRLEIHGGLGVISHAILEKFDCHSSFPVKEYQFFDFQNESTQLVKNFLVHYLKACKQEGYGSLQDSLSTFYETLCVGLNDFNNHNNFLPSSPEKTGDGHNQQENLKLKQAIGGINQGLGFIKKYSLKEQRERTSRMKVKDFKDYFHLPLEAAAREMNMGITTMKKICRESGVPRWPHRKIRSVLTKIAKNRKILEEGSNDHATAFEDIQMYREELARIYKAYTQ